ncbi:hypothetical protein [Streptomyces sp. NPDC001083]
MSARVCRPALRLALVRELADGRMTEEPGLVIADAEVRLRDLDARS